MSCSKWRWTPECDGDFCPGDCDVCTKETKESVEDSTTKFAGEFEFIREFASCHTFRYRFLREQLRILWSAYCMHNDLNPDTLAYDSGIEALWNEMMSDDEWKSFEAFDLFMCELLV